MSTGAKGYGLWLLSIALAAAMGHADCGGPPVDWRAYAREHPGSGWRVR